MSVMKSLHIFAFAVIIASVTQASAQQEVRGVKLQGEASKVFDDKCLACHNRRLIDEAVRNRREMNQVLNNMEKKGVSLTEKERRVIGHFWGQEVFRTEKPDDLPSH